MAGGRAYSVSGFTDREDSYMILFGVTLFIGCFFSFMGWLSLYGYWRSRKRSSTLPYAGGILLILAAFLYPGDNLRPLWWVGLLLDPTICVDLPYLAWTFFQRRNAD